MLGVFRLPLAQVRTFWYDWDMETISEILSMVIPILITTGILLFVYGSISFMFVKDEIKKKNSKKIMIWGFSISTIVVLFWLIVSLTSKTFGPPQGPSEPNKVKQVEPTLGDIYVDLNEKFSLRVGQKAHINSLGVDIVLTGYIRHAGEAGFPYVTFNAYLNGETIGNGYGFSLNGKHYGYSWGGEKYAELTFYDAVAQCEDSDFRDSCLKNTAKRYQDLEVCELIELDGHKRDCLAGK